MERRFLTPEEILQEFQRQQQEDSEGEDSLILDSGTVEYGETSSSDEEQSGNEQLISPHSSTDPSYTASDGTIWSELPVGSTRQGRLSICNILRKSPGPTAYAKRNINTDSALSAFLLLFDQSLINFVANCTTEHGKETDQTWNIDSEELLKFIALTYARGVLGMTHFDLKECWNKQWGHPLFSNSMPRDRYLSIMSNLRFDKKNSRTQRLQSDKFALASSLWDKFISNSRACFNPGESVTADEQLYPMKSRCRFIQYMANKPDKFGLKFWLLVDLRTKYLLNGFPYLGKDESRPLNQQLGEYIVMRLAEPFFNSGINITTNNYFTSVSLAEKLKNHKITLVGTIRKNRKELPNSVKINKSLYSTTTYKNQYGHTLTDYQCKKNKNVLLLSTLHPDITISESIKKKT